MSEDTASIAILSTKIDHLNGSIEEIKQTLATSASVHVTRSEWELRSSTVDERHANTLQRLAALEARRFPWGQVIAAVGISVTIIVGAFEWVPKLVN